MLKQKFLVDFGSKLFIYFLTALTGIVVSRVAGPEVIGVLGYGLSFVSMFFFMFALFGTSHIKLITEGKNIDDCNKVYSIIIFLTFLLFIATVLGFFGVQKYIFDKPFTRTEEIVIFFTIAVVGIQGLFKIPEITFTALIQQAKINFPKLIKAFLFNIGRLIVVLLGFRAIALIGVNLIATLLLIPIYLHLMGVGFFKGSWDSSIFRRYIKIGFPILIITVSLSLMEHYSKVLLKEFSSTTELGYFYGGVSLASMLIMIGGSAGSLFFPLFSKAFSEGKFDYIREQVVKYEHFLFLFVLPIIIILSVNSNTIIIGLLGEAYAPSVPVFSILVFLSFFKIWGIPYYNLMNGINKFNLNARTHVFFVVAFFTVLVLMIHKDFLNLGGVGLAISLLFLYILKLFVWYFFCNKSIHVRFKKELVYFVIFYVIFFFLGQFIYDNYIVQLNFVYKIIFILVYSVAIYGGLYVFKLMKNQDVKYIVSLLKIGDLINYFKDEIKGK